MRFLSKDCSMSYEYVWRFSLEVWILVLQSVEEAECQRAYDLASEVYMASFDRSKPPEEVSGSLFLQLSNFFAL